MVVNCRCHRQYEDRLGIAPVPFRAKRSNGHHSHALRLTMLPHFPADHVINGVYIGSVRLTYYVEGLRQAGIRHVLRLYESGSGWPREFVVFDNSLSDGEYLEEAMLRRGVDFLKARVEAPEKVLVGCGAGISRSE